MPNPEAEAPRSWEATGNYANVGEPNHTRERSAPTGSILVKPILMVAYHYPPEASSTGVQRTLSFSRYLREHDWRATVLTAHPRAYAVSRNDQMSEIPNDVHVHRAFALDAARHLAVKGRYPRVVALPDRWASWWFGAFAAGLRLVRKERPHVIWSTYPIATAHLIGYSLSKLTGIPWIADFRDSMTEPGYPSDPTQKRVYGWIERKTVSSATRVVFTAPGAERMYVERYPDIDASRFSVIANGYSADNLERAEREAVLAPERNAAEPITLLHSGALYPMERDPSCFYGALAQLLREGKMGPGTLRVILRSTGHDAHHQKLIAQHGIQELVSLEPPVPYQEALREMFSVDGLLLFQASNCNHQVPAKVYEYMRAKRPILALTDPEGDTARVLRDAFLDSIVRLDDQQSIVVGLSKFVEDIRNGRARTATVEHVRAQSRRARTEALAALLDEVVQEGTAK